MAYVSIPTRVNGVDIVAAADVNQLMDNFKVFISGTIVNTDFYIDTTNHRVGIGTASPTHSLNVVGKQKNYNSVTNPTVSENIFETFTAIGESI